MAFLLLLILAFGSIAMLLPIARHVARGLEQRIASGVGPVDDSSLARRLEQVETELRQLKEQQRFTQRLLEERSFPQPLP